jgi:hypothetical protein
VPIETILLIFSLGLLATIFVRALTSDDPSQTAPGQKKKRTSDDQEGADDCQTPDQTPLIKRFFFALVWPERWLKKYITKRKEERAKDPIAWRVAKANEWLAVFTLVLIGVGSSQWWVLSGQQTVMQRQLDVMEDDQRPWVRFAITKVDPITIDNNVSFGLEYKLINSGKSPALEVEARFELEPRYGTTQAHDDICNLAAAFHELDKTNPSLMKTIFPGEDGGWTNYQGFGLPLDDRFKIDMTPHAPDKHSIFRMQVFGCIIYRTAVNDKLRHTWVAYDVHKKDDAGIGSAIDWPPTTVDANHVKMTFSALGWNKAD